MTAKIMVYVRCPIRVRICPMSTTTKYIEPQAEGPKRTLTAFAAGAALGEHVGPNNHI